MPPFSKVALKEVFVDGADAMEQLREEQGKTIIETNE